MSHEDFLDIEIKKLRVLRTRAKKIKAIKRIDDLIKKLEDWKNE